MAADRVVLRWSAFDGDKEVEFYRLICRSKDGYEWKGIVQRRYPGQAWEDFWGDYALPFTDLAVALDREEGVTLPRWGTRTRRKKK